MRTIMLVSACLFSVSSFSGNLHVLTPANHAAGRGSWNLNSHRSRQVLQLSRRPADADNKEEHMMSNVFNDVRARRGGLQSAFTTFMDKCLTLIACPLAKFHQRLPVDVKEAISRVANRPIAMREPVYRPFNLRIQDLVGTTTKNRAVGTTTKNRRTPAKAMTSAEHASAAACWVLRRKYQKSREQARRDERARKRERMAALTCHLSETCHSTAPRFNTGTQTRVCVYYTGSLPIVYDWRRVRYNSRRDGEEGVHVEPLQTPMRRLLSNVFRLAREPERREAMCKYQ